MCLETSALSISTYSHAGWVMMRRLLDAAGGVDVRSYRAERVLEPTALASDDGQQDGRRPPPGLSFYQLADRVSAMQDGHGILIGWRRGDDEPCINPVGSGSGST